MKTPRGSKNLPHAVVIPGSRFDKWVASGYSGAGGRFPAICGMPVSLIVRAIGSDGRAATGSELDRHHPESFMNYPG